jgi:hypothetical protein
MKYWVKKSSTKVFQKNGSTAPTGKPVEMMMSCAAISRTALA